MDDEYITIYEKLTNLSGLIKRYQMFKQSNFGPFADSMRGQGRILAMLKIQPEIKIKDLSYLLGIRQQSLSELLNKLEKGGYIERKISNEDKRVVIINLTEKGKNVESPETSYHEFFDCLTSEELKQFEEYLDRIIVAFDKYFIGNSYLKPLAKTDNVFLANVTFEPKCRNNWHIHKAEKGGGQILICVDGEGWYQEEGKEPQSLKVGDVVTIPVNVKHWHGAKKDSWFSHIAVEVPGENTSNEWCEEVTDEEYHQL